MNTYLFRRFLDMSDRRLFTLLKSCLSAVKYRVIHNLTLSQTTNFKLFQTERVCRRQFQTC